MKSGTTGTTGTTGGGERLPAVFLGIAAVELIVILGLYWIGLHFGS